MARIVIMQPYVPTYRAPFFEALAARLAEQGHELVIAAGEPTGAQAKRRDVARIEGVSQRRLRARTMSLGRARLRLVNGRSVWKDADVVVAELAAGATATYGALLQCRRPVGVWGHVEAFTAPDNRLTRSLRRWQTRAATHVLAYTDTGAAVAKDWGVDAARVTSLHNTIDVTALSQAIERVKAVDRSTVRSRLGLGSGPVFAMIGGIDASKRIDLVVGALDALWASRPDIQLLVGGRGELEPAFDAAVARGQVRLVGYVGNDAKAEFARVATALLNPGRVGLIAVESMAMKLPIVTTSGARHGPEYEYLTPGTDSIECGPNASELAATLIALADDSERVGQLSTAIGERLNAFALSHMVDRYASALESLVDDAKTRSGHSKM
ncbi:glycosyltransferase involved in cell wall biosynthesis [Curtobacterium sp. AG1037]|uniref:glycosyltransferase family 4 protein n=1 Tax=Curtobacterium sp. AG1037 TaxID=2183990 RepID=UPI000E0BA4CD|nr:glycosyltransferase family 4 protein [Curtobacterium sp. AG1037]RDH98525.1 glycosyltransferase involved in cell wall biosynthesis [Curtobacterium sp. AG1037]